MRPALSFAVASAISSAVNTLVRLVDQSAQFNAIAGHEILHEVR